MSFKDKIKRVSFIVSHIYIGFIGKVNWSKQSMLKPHFVLVIISLGSKTTIK